MLGVLFLILGSFSGYCLIKRFFPLFFSVTSQKSLSGEDIVLPVWYITIPASFILGTLIITTVTYFSTWIFAYFFDADTPLMYGNIFTMTLFAIIVLYSFSKKIKSSYKKKHRAISKKPRISLLDFCITHSFELGIIIIFSLFWGFFFFRSFNIDQDMINISYAVHSDFGAHLASIRSFSLGSNFPTQYPHFAGELAGYNNIRYHFFFMFLSGNLEFLGMRLDWAFNLPSLLAIISFIMLLYSFTTLLIGKRIVSLITLLLFTFRSSFAFFIYISDKIAEKGAFDTAFSKIIFAFQKIINVGEEPGQIGLMIGRTPYESWGIWALKVYTNKRHFAFTLALMMLVLIFVLPMFKKMISSFNRSDFEGLNIKEKISVFIKKILGGKDSWLASNIYSSLIIGIILGASSFWNGSAFLSVISILFVIAIFSKHRLNHVIIACPAVLIAFIQSKFFTGGTGVKVKSHLGYVAGKDLKDFLLLPAEDSIFESFIYYFKFIFSYIPQNFSEFLGFLKNVFLYYYELLGFLPLAVLIGVILAPKRTRLLALVFFAPFALANLFTFSIEATSNHVIIIISIILLNIFVANLIYKIFTIKNKELSSIVFIATIIIFSFGLWILSGVGQPNNVMIFILPVFFILLLCVIIIRLLKDFSLTTFKLNSFAVSSAIIILLVLTMTGVMDVIGHYNTDKYSPEIKIKDSLIEFVVNETAPEYVFLIEPAYQHKILLCGRKVFLGGEYFTWSAGYDVESRIKILKEIYEGRNLELAKSYFEKYNIGYVVIDHSNRTSKKYTLNEAFFNNNFELIFSSDDVYIYKVY